MQMKSYVVLIALFLFRVTRVLDIEAHRTRDESFAGPLTGWYLLLETTNDLPAPPLFLFLFLPHPLMMFHYASYSLLPVATFGSKL